MPPRLPLPLPRVLSTALRQYLRHTPPPTPRCVLPVLFTRTYAGGRGRGGSKTKAAPVTPNPKLTRVADEAIGALTVNYVDADGQFHEDVNLRKILASIDREVYTLVCVNPQADADQPRLCKVLTKASIEEYDKNSFKADREKRKLKRETSPQNVLKEVEFSWAISEHDLGHRMRKVQEFMEKGFRVAISLGTKRGMMKQPLGTMVELLSKIRETCEQWGKECKAPEGAIGMRYTMLFEGRKLQKEETVEGEDGVVEEGSVEGNRDQVVDEVVDEVFKDEQEADSRDGEEWANDQSPGKYNPSG
ncbi:hypothetical protein BZA05DRAFT_391907 [Tricharina praecox]|uniref:uncharacterized protein n=1 Tax=Tricharina praecox TaxID=43433 RepID=UPI00221F3DB4|nr:uncharacterized protein BZA05DRAFT_391907 [Tricharina praecox]KAI5854561.1 hypothetical protein BZA05DRAFT_391907 [Tricharina praecox]